MTARAFDETGCAFSAGGAYNLMKFTHLAYSLDCMYPFTIVIIIYSFIGNSSLIYSILTLPDLLEVEDAFEYEDIRVNEALELLQNKSTYYSLQRL